MRSQIYYQCIAGANSPLALVDKGLEEFIVGYDIPPSKLVLGLPWYAYVYPCESLAEDVCHIKPVRWLLWPSLDLTVRRFRFEERRAATPQDVRSIMQTCKSCSLMRRTQSRSIGKTFQRRRSSR